MKNVFIVILVLITIFYSCNEDGWDPGDFNEVELSYEEPFYDFRTGEVSSIMPDDINDFGIMLEPWSTDLPAICGNYQITDESSFEAFSVPLSTGYENTCDEVPLNQVLLFELADNSHALVKVVEDGVTKSTNQERSVKLHVNYPAFVGGGDTFKDRRDGTIYKTVQIGNQVWMAENLKYLPKVSPPTMHSEELGYCYVYDYYGKNEKQAMRTDAYKEYGVLYNHTAALNVCPSGWRLPTVADWVEMENQFGGNNHAGNALKEQGTLHWKEDGEWKGGTNESGFTALPGGLMENGHAEFFSMTEVGLWWLADEGDHPGEAQRRDLSHNQKDVGDHSYTKAHGYSVRCIKGETNTTPGGSAEVGTMKDPRDLKVYKTVKIGEQIWMAENLAFLPYLINGINEKSYEDSMTYVYGIINEDYDDAAWELESWNTYGALYNWPMAKMACPAGWKLPSKQDWSILADEVGGKANAGKALKEEGTKHWSAPNTGAKNSSGFNALPGGFAYTNRTSSEKFVQMGEVGAWWSSTESSLNEAWRRDLSYDHTDFGEHAIVKNHGYSVRCLKIPVEGETMIDTRDGREYKIVKIGDQVWMAENMAYIPIDADLNYLYDMARAEEIMNSSKRYYVYDFFYPHRRNAFFNTNFKNYGVLYNWYAADDVCPAGWHLPSNDEWKKLADEVGGKEQAGKALKITGNEYWIPYSTSVNNSSGFSALPGGLVHNLRKEYVSIGEVGSWWSSSETGNTSAYGQTYAVERDLSYNHNDLGEHSREKTMGASVRCIKD